MVGETVWQGDQRHQRAAVYVIICNNSWVLETDVVTRHQPAPHFAGKHGKCREWRLSCKSGPSQCLGVLGPRERLEATNPRRTIAKARVGKTGRSGCGWLLVPKRQRRLVVNVDYSLLLQKLHILYAISGSALVESPFGINTVVFVLYVQRGSTLI